MWKILPIALLQSVLLALGQVTLKLLLEQIGHFSFTWEFLRNALSSWWFALCAMLFGGASLLWFHILKNYPLSVAYPLVSLSYVMGMLAALFIFHEEIPLSRWIGLALIMLGIIFIVQK